MTKIGDMILSKDIKITKVCSELDRKIYDYEANLNIKVFNTASLYELDDVDVRDIMVKQVYKHVYGELRPLIRRLAEISVSNDPNRIKRANKVLEEIKSIIGEYVEIPETDA